ncbi:methyltransferase [Actinomadura sp. DSM 109109]|nr:methyltransferase [Actinomadura lepetitiana]
MKNEDPPGRSSGANSAFPWDMFDPEKYVENNYKKLLLPDKEILTRGVAHFAQVADWRNKLGMGMFAHGIDVGPGSNLYPTLSMLAFCRKITLIEYGAANVEYLRREIQHLSDSWRPFWAVISPFVGGRSFEWARQTLPERVEVVQGNLFTDLPLAEFDIGTMHFVAESLTAETQEVRWGVRNFTRSLMPRSPFAMANMEGSRGYWVGDVWYPAAPVSAQDVDWMLDLLAFFKEVEQIAKDGPSVHLDPEGRPVDDYTGYLVSTGLAF